MPATTTIRLVGDAIDSSAMTLTALTGRDAVGELFAFDLELVCSHDDWDAGKLLQAPCRLELAQGVLLPGMADSGMTILPIHGVLSEICQLHKHDEHYVYRARMVPTAWRLGLNYRSRTFVEQSVPDVLRQVLEDGGLPADQFELRLNGSYPTRPVINQYQESDLDFVWRLLEHEGIAAFFEHDDEGSTWVLSDDPQGFPTLPADPTLPYRPDSAGWNQSEIYTGSWFDPPALHRLHCVQRALTGKIVLQDYQPDHPDLDLQAEAEVEGAATFGSRYEYGGNYDSPDAGKHYATIRSQELACRERIFEGCTNSRALRAGATFEVAEHFRKSFNRHLLLQAVEHRAEGSLEHMDYVCRFEAVATDVPFRPLRRTRKPAIAGVLPAKVDAAGDGQYAEVDDQGSYKVKFPFDLSDADGGTASPPLRMAQAYGGAGMGMHFPLHKDVEVSVGFVHGDPDRPYISQSLPNPQTPSQISSQNQTGCVLRSGGGNSIVFDDSDGSQRFDVNASYDCSLTIANDHAVSVGNNETYDVAVDRTASVGSNQASTVGADDSLEVGGNQTITIAGNQESTVSGNRQASIGGGDTTSVAGDGSLTIGGSRTETIGSADNRTVGAADAQTIGADQSVTIGGSATQTVAGAQQVSVGGAATLTVGGSYSINAASTIEAAAPKIELTAVGGITITVGGSSISIDPAGISISAPMVTINGTAMVDIKGGLVKNNA